MTDSEAERELAAQRGFTGFFGVVLVEVGADIVCFRPLDWGGHSFEGSDKRYSEGGSARVFLSELWAT